MGFSAKERTICAIFWLCLARSSSHVVRIFSFWSSYPPPPPPSSPTLDGFYTVASVPAVDNQRENRRSGLLSPMPVHGLCVLSVLFSNSPEARSNLYNLLQT